jgi:hypothetical protein
MPKAKPINPSKKQLSNDTSAPKKCKSLTAAQKQEVCLKKIFTLLKKQRPNQRV